MIESTPAFDLPATPDAGQPGHLDAHQKINAVLETLTAFVRDALVPAINEVEAAAAGFYEALQHANARIDTLTADMSANDTRTLAEAKAYADQVIGSPVA